MKNYLELFIGGALSLISTTQLEYRNYSENAGLFDIFFTKNDITILILITLGWVIKLILDTKNPNTKNPNFFDVTGSFLITYVLTGGLYALVIFKNYDIGLTIFLMSLFAIFSTDFLRFLEKVISEKEFQEELKKILIELFKSIGNRLKKIIS